MLVHSRSSRKPEAVKTRLPHIAPRIRAAEALLLVVLLAALAAVYHSVLVELVRDWIRDANYSHGFLMPVVSGFLVFGCRKALLDQQRSPSMLGVLGILAACAMLVLGTAGAEVFTQRMSFLVLLTSLVLFLFGWGHLKMTAFPIAFLFFAIPLPYVIYYGVTSPMQALAARVAVISMKGLGIPAMLQGNMIHLANTSLEVVEACSGIRSLYAFLAVGALVARSAPVPVWARICLFLLAIPISIAGNSVRVLGSGLGAYLIGPEAATGTAHDMFGIVVFIVTLVVFLILKGILRKLWSSGTSSPS